jgi:hypothetical protein
MDEKRVAMVGRALETLLALLLVAGVFYAFRERFLPLDSFKIAMLGLIAVAVTACVLMGGRPW